MPRYIDADALLNKVERYFAGLPIVVHHDMVEYIENEPTADVVERKRGKWWPIKAHISPAYDLEGNKTWGSLYGCSECGFLHSVIEGFGIYAFCPHCGAEMEGRSE